MNTHKVIVSVAPVAHVGTVVPPGARNPVTAEDIAAEVIGCAEAGASMVHLHVRDERGEQTADLGTYARTLDLIRRETDIVIQGSTGGKSTLSLAERCVSINEPRTQVASLNMGSVNFGDGVYVNTLPDIRFWVAEMKKHGVVPELEVFDVSMLATVDKLVDEGVLVPPLNYNFCLGFHGALLADPRHLYYLSSLLPSGAHWGFIHEGMQDYRVLAAALGLGARAVRVGFEDGRHLAPGRVASTNVDLVRSLVDLIRLVGLDVATPCEAKAFMGVRRS